MCCSSLLTLLCDSFSCHSCRSFTSCACTRIKGVTVLYFTSFVSLRFLILPHCGSEDRVLAQERVIPAPVCFLGGERRNRITLVIRPPRPVPPPARPWPDLSWRTSSRTHPSTILPEWPLDKHGVVRLVCTDGRSGRPKLLPVVPLMPSAALRHAPPHAGTQPCPAALTETPSNHVFAAPRTTDAYANCKNSSWGIDRVLSATAGPVVGTRRPT